MNVTLGETRASDEAMLQRLFQLYTHDFSGYWAGQARGDLSDDGLFPAYPLAPYWSTPGWAASLVRYEGVLAGVALVNDRALNAAEIDWNVAEFFIARKYRGQRIGQTAAAMVLARQPGRWQIAVTRANLPARQFWRRVVADAAGDDWTIVESDDDSWRGPIFYFSARRA